VPDDHRHADRFTLREGESVELALTWTRSWDPVPPRLTIEDRIDSTRISWGLWARSCAYTGSYREAVVRSLLEILASACGVTAFIAFQHLVACRHVAAGQNEALKKYSIETLPAVMEHLEMAKEQYAMLTQGAGKPR
jgi:hypothetical protein